MKNLLRPLFYVAFSLVTVWTYLVPDAKGFTYPAMARVFFWHLPCSVLLLAFMFTGIYFSFRTFRKLDKALSPVTDTFEKIQWDIRAASAMELGFIWAILTMVTGILFSLVQWGAWWQWDPRQTSFLLALLLYGGYFAIRSAFPDPEKCASFSGVYNLASALPIFFLVLIFPRLPQVQAVSFHPTNTIMQGQLKGQYGYVTIVMNVLMAILSIWLYRMRTKTLLYELTLDYKNNGNMEISSRSPASTSVVRPVSLPIEDRPSSASD